jgi:hypothetical protein
MPRDGVIGLMAHHGAHPRLAPDGDVLLPWGGSSHGGGKDRSLGQHGQRARPGNGLRVSTRGAQQGAWRRPGRSGPRWASMPRAQTGDGTRFAPWAFPSFRLYDGRSAVSPWLQETPTHDPVGVGRLVEAGGGRREARHQWRRREGGVAPRVDRATCLRVDLLHPGVVAIPTGQRCALQPDRPLRGRAITAQNPVAPCPGAGRIPASTGHARDAKTGPALRRLQATHDQTIGSWPSTSTRAACGSALRGRP